MHPYISLQVAGERAKDMHRRAAANRLAKSVRGSGQGRGRVWITRMALRRTTAARQPACGQHPTLTAR